MRLHVLLAAVLLLAAGCATSPTFQHTAALVVPHLAADAGRYAAADASLDPATRAGRVAAASSLAASAASASAVTTQGVYAAWAPVDGWYPAYVAADPTLPDPYKAARVARWRKLKALIDAEAARPFGASTRPVPGDAH